MIHLVPFFRSNYVNYLKKKKINLRLTCNNAYSSRDIAAISADSQSQNAKQQDKDIEEIDASLSITLPFIHGTYTRH